MAKNHTRVDVALVRDIAAFIKRYVYLPSDQHALILGLWVLHTWLFETARATPYLYIHSADKQSGKTRLLEVLEILVRNPLRATSITPSVLFRAIDVMKPALLWDEVDTIWAGARNEIMRSIINGGYKQGGNVLRIQNQQPRSFNTFCAKALAGIYNGFLPDTIQDRCIPVKLKRKPREIKLDAFYPSQVSTSNEVENLLARIEAFVKAHARDVAYQRPEPMTTVSDRQWEICEPLIAIAQVLGLEDATRKATVAMFASVKDAPSLQTMLLTDLREAFAERERLFSDNLASALGPTWTPKLLSQWLAPYDIQPQEIRIGNQTKRGYYRHQFDAAWEAI